LANVCTRKRACSISQQSTKKNGTSRVFTWSTRIFLNDSTRRTPFARACNDAHCCTYRRRHGLTCYAEVCSRVHAGEAESPPRAWRMGLESGQHPWAWSTFGRDWPSPQTGAASTTWRGEPPPPLVVRLPGAPAARASPASVAAAALGDAADAPAKVRPWRARARRPRRGGRVATPTGERRSCGGRRSVRRRGGGTGG